MAKTTPTKKTVHHPAIKAVTFEPASAPARALKVIHVPAHLRYDQIIPDPDNARQDFDEAELKGLAETLPAPMDVVGRLWSRAAAVCPGITVDELPIGQSRRVMLTAARNLIDAMLGEVTHG